MKTRLKVQKKMARRRKQTKRKKKKQQIVIGATHQKRNLKL